jgi:hypothetical protein
MRQDSNIITPLGVRISADREPHHMEATSRRLGRPRRGMR